MDILKTTAQKLRNDLHMETNFDEMYDKYKDYDFADAKPVAETPLLSELQENHQSNITIQPCEVDEIPQRAQK